MEKLTPHYDLAAVQAVVAELGVAAFTKTALDGGRDMGLTGSEMLSVIAALARGNLYKSDDHPFRSSRPAGRLSRERMWGKEAYAKITMRAETPVIQFKEG